LGAFEDLTKGKLREEPRGGRGRNCFLSDNLHQGDGNREKTSIESSEWVTWKKRRRMTKGWIAIARVKKRSGLPAL